MKNALEKRVLFFVFLVLFVTLATNALFELDSFRRQYRDALVLRCESLAGALRTSIEKVLALGLALEELDGVNGRCQEIVATDPDISYCLVENSDGQYVFASDPSFLMVSGRSVLASVDASTSVVMMPRLGEVYEVAVPILDSDGSSAGAVRLGFPSSILRELTRNLVFRHGILLGLYSVLAFCAIAYFTRRVLVSPIRKLCDVSREVAHGHFQVKIPPLEIGEFEQLGSALRDMAHSLRMRDEKILEGYHELEETNLLLQRAYEEQERTGVELAKNREMYRSLLEHASDAIIVTDERDEVVLFNRRAQEIFGSAPDEVMGKNLFFLMESLHVEQLERHFQAHQRVLAGEEMEMELRYRSPVDGKPHVGWVRGSLFHGGDGKRLVQAIVRDITKEKEIQENLERSANELLRLNQMKDSFLGLVSHELKTPLTIILGYAELLLNGIPEQIDATFTPMLQNISDAAERLNRVVQDMVDVSLIDGRNLYLTIHDVQINALVEAAAKNMSFPMEQRRQQLKLKLAPDLPEIKGDPERLLQMINNLMKNAIKFTPDGGAITLETRLVASTEELPRYAGVPEGFLEDIAERNRPFVDLVVRDTGIGIPDEQQEYIFEKFFGLGKIEEHSSGQTQFNGKGPGLGLAIVKGIVELHGGEIWIESCQEQSDGSYPGCTFHVLLPLPDCQSPGNARNSSDFGLAG